MALRQGDMACFEWEQPGPDAHFVNDGEASGSSVSKTRARISGSDANIGTGSHGGLTVNAERKRVVVHLAQSPLQHPPHPHCGSELPT